MLRRSVSAVIWALPFCPSPFLPHISAAFSLTRHAGCTFSIRSISLGWLIQFSRFRWEVLYCPLILRIGERSFRKVFSKKVFELSMNFPIGMEIFCVLSLLESEKGYFARCFWKKFKKILSRPIQSAFCYWTAHFSIMYMLAAAQCPEVLFLYLVNCCVINSGKILAGHAKVFCRLCKRKTME